MLIAVLMAAACSPGLRASLYSTILQDDRPVPPFAITRDLYYVGSSDIGIYALQTTDGLIILEGAGPCLSR